MMRKSPWRKSGWNSGGHKAHPDRLLGVVCGEEVPLLTGEGSADLRRGLCALPKKFFSLEMVCFGKF